MEWRRTTVYDGASRWHAEPVIEVEVDAGTLAGWSLATDHAAAGRLDAWRVALESRPHECRFDPRQPVPGPGFDTLRAAGDAPAVLRWLVGTLQAAAGTTPAGTWTEALPAGFLLATTTEDPRVTRACLDTARECLVAAVAGHPFDAAAAVRELVDVADTHRLGPSTRAIVRAAAARGIPTHRVTTASLVQLGEGARQRRIWTAETDATSSIGESIAQDKELTKMLLRQVGVPVPLGHVADSPDDACRAAEDLGYPVVVKPRDANHGRGISFGLSSAEQVRDSFALAARENSSSAAGVIVEQFAPGVAHRLLVVGDRVVAASRGQHDAVVGNGRQTIAELVEEANRDPLRGENYTDLLGVMRIDEVARSLLARGGLGPDSVPEAGQRVIIKVNGDLTTDETAEVHPEVAARAVLAARTVGLDIAGLDVVAEDIGQPLEAQRGMVIEVNAGPGIFMHVAPLHGRPQPVGEAIVDLLYPPGAEGRILLVAVAETSDAAATAAAIGRMLEALGKRVAVAAGGKLARAGQPAWRVGPGDGTAIRALKAHPGIDAGVFVSHGAAAATVGLGTSRCDVAVFPAVVVPTPHLLALVHALGETGVAVVPAESPQAAAVVNHLGRARVVVIGDGGASLPTGRAVAPSAAGIAWIADGRPVLEAGVPAKGTALAAVAAAWAAGLPSDRLAGAVQELG
ncbi:MAG: cyanophycin synthetase [Planctomycetia bacterium]|nr:cyanophycin synthetase [Planctomycetia bacterium]